MFNTDSEKEDIIALKGVIDDQPELFRLLWDAWAAILARPTALVKVPSNDIWEDSDVRQWLQQRHVLRGSFAIAWQIFTTPTSDVATIRARQAAISSLPLDTRHTLLQLHENERDVLWLFSLPKLADTSSMQILFPQIPFLRVINYSSALLTFYHMYRGLMVPAMNVVSPLTTVFGPYIYIRRNTGFAISLTSYLRIIYGLARNAAALSGDVQKDAVRIGSLGLYIGLYIMGVLQSFEFAAAVRHIRKGAMARLNSIRCFVATSEELQERVSEDTWASFGAPARYEGSLSKRIPHGMKGLWALMTDDTLRTDLQNLTIRMYLLDALSIVRCKGICFTRILSDSNTHASFVGMSHPSLLLANGGRRHVVRNPACLKKSLIVTGPNAAGKTTYVRSLCANILLSQSFGVSSAKSAILAPYHTLGTFMRISDTLGRESLFEAEVKRCADIIRQAENCVSTGERAVFFLDEPMHSTPPVEGSAVSMATIEHLGELPGIRTVTTTHYFAITNLARSKPSLFQNISMEAVATSNSSFHFPYRIRNGPSFQCIALELMEKHTDLPTSFLESATKWKNKLCAREVITHYAP